MLHKAIEIAGPNANPVLDWSMPISLVDTLNVLYGPQWYSNQITIIMILLFIGLMLFFAYEDGKKKKKIKLLDKTIEDLHKREEYVYESFGARVKQSEEQAKAAIEAEKKRARIVSAIATYGPGDSEFLNSIAKISEETEVKFLFDVVHRSIYEAILTATTNEMIINAAGKGKGVRMLEETMNNPCRLFGVGESENQDVID
jgi:hypothetical protein